MSRLLTCHEEIVAVCREVVPIVDNTVIWGIRYKKEQNECYSRGTSTKLWPDSRHNKIDLDELSDAVDLAPWHVIKPHIRWEAEYEFIYLAGHMMMAAAALGVKLRWGGDWDQDHDLYDRNKPFDLGHFERIP
jgi:peptidoglycan L-alanyl-D-glutamate endopeptidase CwlK